VRNIQTKTILESMHVRVAGVSEGYQRRGRSWRNTASGPNPEFAITSSTPSTSRRQHQVFLRHLIPDDTADSEPNRPGTTSPVSLVDLFDFNDTQWAGRYNEYAQNHLSEELELCELLNRDSATEEGAEVDVDEMTSASEILTG